MSNYCATLTDAGLREPDRLEAEEIFCRTLDARLGGPAQVVAACLAYREAREKYEMTPLPAEATETELAAVDLWETAESNATMAAFAGWLNLEEADAAHFEIALNLTPQASPKRPRP